MATLDAYSTVAPTFGALPTWLTSDEDRRRILSYQRYEEMYWNDPNGYKLILRGSESNPLYIPSAMTIVEACNRYLAKNWTFTTDPKLGTPADRDALSALLTPIFRREEVWTKFLTQKRYCLIRGDACWFILADPTKEPGHRLRILELDPASYFPITAPGDEDRVIGCHIVEQTFAKDGKTLLIKRQTYRKPFDEATGAVLPGPITYEMSWWQLGAWDDRNMEAQDLKKADQPPSPAVPLTPLPPQITQLPVYHIKNQRTPGSPFGSSELRGMETLIAGVSQAVSDEDLALALAGLGVYVTTSGPPVNTETGEEENWQIGPGYVAEIDPEASFTRVPGVTSVQPSIDHVRFVQGAMREAKGIPDVALGVVDAQIAESGIALALKMAPILSANAEKEQEMLGVYDQMLYDITTMWLPAYEQFESPAVAVSVVDDPLPVNREKIIAEITTLLTASLITAEYARELLSEKLGYEFPAEMGANVVAEMTELAKARNADPFLDRVGRELDPESGAGGGSAAPVA